MKPPVLTASNHVSVNQAPDTLKIFPADSNITFDQFHHICTSPPKDVVNDGDPAAEYMFVYATAPVDVRSRDQTICVSVVPVLYGAANK